jgi:hypothetical protein
MVGLDELIRVGLVEGFREGAVEGSIEDGFTVGSVV